MESNAQVACPTCTFLNPSQERICRMCSKTLPAPSLPSLPSSAPLSPPSASAPPTRPLVSPHPPHFPLPLRPPLPPVAPAAAGIGVSKGVAAGTGAGMGEGEDGGDAALARALAKREEEQWRAAAVRREECVRADEAMAAALAGEGGGEGDTIGEEAMTLSLVREEEAARATAATAGTSRDAGREGVLGGLKREAKQGSLGSKRKLQQHREGGVWGSQGLGPGESDEAMAMRLLREEQQGAEEASFRELQERYGLQQEEDLGPRQDVEKTDLVSAQLPEPYYGDRPGRAAGDSVGVGAAGEGVILLLRKCLISNAKRSSYRPGCYSHTVLCASPVVHFDNRRKEDFGWGCGWRNIMMLCSHLLASNAHARAHMFGGCGYVPQIHNLQAWLELAWQAGFDPGGRQQLQGRVAGTKKWIGATECCALLRFFHLRAQVEDFRGQRVLVGKAAGKKEKAAAGAPTRRGNECFKCGQRGHWAAECSVATEGAQGGSGGGKRRRLSQQVHLLSRCVGCGVSPVRGKLYFQLQTGKEMCGTCYSTLGYGDRQQWAASGERLTGQQRERMHAPPATAFSHQALVRWVSQYFGLDTQQQGGATVGGAGGAGGGGGAAVGVPVFRSGGCSVGSSARGPLFFQHEGHSRTIVGIERRKARANSPETVSLLILDPSSQAADLCNKLRKNEGWERLVKRSLSTLKKQEYQIVHVDLSSGPLATGKELESFKQIHSILHKT